ncbi:ABC transporter substrate-binding protein [Chengkuizengella sediminis]|uniref:ABC transporter substrate-binding protein n=1 Tax=Chengkuizengella sediminis TaxID=1885917 RepID=UPI0013894952|nr:ABC transporter substrate-binding protein [Chengkuizengella sediminis]NDI35801.1 ABC transporter substrate-binding protein [Chengkuizengella sediminis]
MKKILMILLVFVLAFSLAACGNNPSEVSENQDQGTQDVAESNDTTQEETEETAAENIENGQTIYPLTVTDASGNEVTIEQKPERIVSLAPSITEILFALGLDENIVGVTEYDDFPEEATTKPKIGGILDGNTEAILAAEPDLVIGGLSLNEAIIIGLAELDIQVFTIEPNSIDEVIEDIQLLGLITDANDAAETVVTQMADEKQQVVEAVSGISEADKKKIYLEFSEGWTVGSGEFMNELIELSGGINVAADQAGWLQISEEKIIEENPDVIIYTTKYMDLKPVITERSGWSEITAIRDDSLVGMNDDLISRPGPRITQGLLEIAKGIYPELVK